MSTDRPGASTLARILEIRSALWASRAAALVGAGFSRNAISRAATVQAPTWSGLARCMVDDLYPDAGPHREAALIKAATSEGALLLAGEVEANHGRQRLDALIERAVPDAQLEPGPLHRLLVKLPWTDILTTNYDQLIERCASPRHYHFVRQPADVPKALRPRIVKLHGCMAVKEFSPRYVITRPDFMSYARARGALENLARQALLESSLVLLGFSGDDPAFLHWSHRVHEMLGEDAPAIYLCGVLGLSEPRRVALEKQRIMPVDLSPLFPEDEGPGRHARALEWLLLSLELGQPPNPLAWPDALEAPRSEPSHTGLPPLIGESKRPRPFPYDCSAETVLARWHAEREVYPGWIVLPARVLDRVLPELVGRRASVLSHIEKQPRADRVGPLFELWWRTDLSMQPLDEEAAKAIEQSLHSAGFDEGTGEASPSYEICALALALVRHACDTRDEDRFARWNAVLERAAPTTFRDLEERWADLWARRKVLQAIYHFHTLNPMRCIELLRNDWPPGLDDPRWTAHRALLLDRLGQMQSAEPAASLAKEAIGRTQEELGRRRLSLRLLATESRLVGKTIWSETEEVFKGRAYASPEYEGRGGERERTGCDWEALSRSFALETRFSDPARWPQEPSDSEREEMALEVARAAAVARFAQEHGGHLPRHENRFLPHLVVELLRRTSEDYAMTIEWHYGGERLQPSWHRLAALESGTVERGWRGLERGIERLVEQVQQPSEAVPFPVRNTEKVVLRAVSQLVVRRPVEDASRMLDRVLALADKWANPTSLALPECLRRLGAQIQPAQILRFLALPCWGFPRPVNALSEEAPFAPQREAIAPVIEHCLAAACDADPSIRTDALERLGYLDRRGLLRDHERRRFAEALWSRRTSRGLPAETRLQESKLLEFPEPEAGCTAAALRRHVLASQLPAIFTVETDSEGEQRVVSTLEFPRDYAMPFTLLLHAGATLAWSEADATRIARIFLRHWSTEPRPLRASSSNHWDAHIERYLPICRALDRVILPKLPPRSPVFEQLRDILVEATTCQIPLLELWPALLRALPDEAVRAEAELCQGIGSTIRGFATSALWGASHWVRHARTGSAPPIPAAPLWLASAVVAQRSPGALLPALVVLTDILAISPDVLPPGALELLHAGLVHLQEELAYRRFATPGRPIPYDDVPTYRAACVALSSALHHGACSTHPAVRRWLEQADCDPLPKVREAAVWRPGR